MLSYIDPGSGSFIFQIILASAAGAIYTCRTAILGFLAKFAKKGSTEIQTEIKEVEEVKS